MNPREKKLKKSLEKKQLHKHYKRLHQKDEEGATGGAYTYLMNVTYDGSEFGGYSKQSHKNSIENNLQDAFQQVFHKHVSITESSRTDAKVHAYCQKVMFKIQKEQDCEKLKNALNEVLKSSIEVTSIELKDQSFHCRYDVLNKTYMYKIARKYDIFKRNYQSYVDQDLDIEKMKESTKYLIGTHDFSSFCSSKAQVTNKVRTINFINIDKEDDLIIIKINGSGFLYNMVRIIVGTLIDIGAGKIEPTELKVILDSMDRSKSSETAPAQGLYLLEINY